MSVFSGMAGRTLRAWLMLLVWLAVIIIATNVWGLPGFAWAMLVTGVLGCYGLFD